MTAAELKASILDLAIRGKLVAQDPDDEPASELLARIAAEKAKLIKEKKLKKEKPLAPIPEDEKPFELPNGWIWTRIGKAFNLQAGEFISASNINEQPLGDASVPCFGGNGIRGYVLKSNRFGVSPIIGRQGALCGNLNLSTEVFYATEHAVVVDVFAGVTPLFAYWFLRAMNLNRFATATAQPGLAVATVDQVPFPLPPLAEQKRIVAKVEELMPLVERYEKAEAKRIELEAALPGDLEKSILQEAIQGKLVEQNPNDEPASELLARIAAEKAKLIKEKKLKKEKPLAPITEDEKPFELPNGWAWCRLGEICKTISGVSYQKGDVGNERGVRILRGGNVKDGATVILRDDDVWLPAFYRDEEKTVELGDVIVVASTGSSVVIGRPGIVKDKYDDTLIGAFLRIVRCNDKSYQKYIHLIFQSEYYRENIRKAVKGIGIKNLKAEYITTMVIPLPPLAEQKRIVAKVDELLGAIRRLH